MGRLTVSAQFQLLSLTRRHDWSTVMRVWVCCAFGSHRGFQGRFQCFYLLCRTRVFPETAVNVPASTRRTAGLGKQLLQKYNVFAASVSCLHVRRPKFLSSVKQCCCGSLLRTQRYIMPPLPTFVPFACPTADADQLLATAVLSEVQGAPGPPTQQRRRAWQIGLSPDAD